MRSTRTRALAHTTSTIALLTWLALPGTASAQVAAESPTNAQPAETAPVASQDQDTAGQEDIVVTGVRASLQRAIDIKRNSSGVVDAISAEDIGKFPDTNLAESLQRITGVSINRVNGEGSQVAVRGFSGGYNLVTVNGRQLPASNIDTSGANAFARGAGRSFDFQNVASEGVSGLEVYKTGRAAIPSGGIGAAINIVTRKPLDARESGLTGSIGAKALYDTSVEKAEGDKNRITPELSGLLSYANEDNTFGAAVFGSYQLRHSASVNSNPNYWNVVPTSTFFTPGTFINALTVVDSRPTAPYVLIPNDSRYAFSENRRERINFQGVLQFRPTDRLEISIDSLYAQNRLSEERSEQTNWFNRPFSRVTFDDNPNMATATFLSDYLPSGPKDEGFEQQRFATKTELVSVGLNAKWEFADNFTLKLDGHHSKSTSSPDNPNGTSATLFSMGAPVIAGHTLDFTSGFPQQTQTLNDCVKGNCNNQLDVGDLGTQIGRTVTANQTQTITQARAELGWDLGGGSRFDAGFNYTDSKMRSTQAQTQQTLGNWGIEDTGIVNRLAGDLVDTICITCKFDDFDPGATGSSLIAFRGNAVDLLNVFSPYYAGLGNPDIASAPADDTVQERIWAVYGQFTWNGEVAQVPANLVIGARYEQTRVRSDAVQTYNNITWISDNDFRGDASGVFTTITQRGNYNNLLPAVDFSVEPIQNVKARVSFSRTLGRPDYGSLFATSSAGAPGRPTLLGGIPTGSSGNANLLPLLSDNFDVSVEWYYKPSSFVSLGFFDKRVSNFLGNGVINQELFGLRDPTSGAPGSRSGIAAAYLRANARDLSDVNLFTYTALLIRNNGNQAAATAQFEANYSNGALNQGFVDTVLNQVDIVADANDPLFNFSVSQPINNREGKINGFEFALTHFFGDTGFGFAGSYTKVSGDVNVDPYADPLVNIFALTGLGDSANATAIYDKSGLSARVAYNWRASYLTATNQGGNRNPLFVAPFGTLDANISYDVNDNIALTLEGINLLSESVRTYGRTERNLVFAQELKPRILFGARYRF
ncbi:TonB-dependent receptor [Sphingomonas qomolangmaensis]|uniref:TonB-dependent receptor n=1 Tax=Sphingomonas qomolangmaensis TaxID=2918765 RepID=A0ABY5L5N4_9SPHN|nr:TonB-dependent receptor [Sphingomonas qomolangmaensis]UUL81227.1 TonB-dependent receptor [Sphingomonas qomolangmaensis]